MSAGPEVQSLYWLDATVLAASDPSPSRLAVVVDVPPAATGTIGVVVRAAGGEFSRLVPVQGVLWPGAVLAPAGRLDDATFAAVRARFAR
jgi:hypothetical protein